VEMARCQPASVDEFAEINGVGAVKLADFGEIFLAAIADAPAVQADDP